MLNLILATAALALVAGLIGHRIRTRRRVRRRSDRRRRRNAYARLWEQVMIRPRTKRLTVSSHIDPAERDRQPGSR